MRPRLLQLACCPACQAPLSPAEPLPAGEPLVEGELVCAARAHRYPVLRGMPHLFVDDEGWAPKRREAVGWVAIHKEQGIYEPSDRDNLDIKAPYNGVDPWVGVARSFDAALERLALRGQETVLDLGAGRGWAAKHFALRGCEAVALDIVSDEKIGLGRGRALMEAAGTYFERVIGDGENLPFQPETFDVVFCCGTLHHSSNLPLLIAQIARVLKPGGVLCAINEPSVALLTDREAALARDAGQELRLGINETRPSIVDYGAALAMADLAVEMAQPAMAGQMDVGTLRNWGQDLGAVLGPIAWRQPARAFWRAVNFARNRWRWRLAGPGSLPQPPAALDDRNRLAFTIMLWIDTELHLLARKRG